MKDRPIPAFVVSYSDSAFSNPHQVAVTEPPVFDPDAFTYKGKEMDGLESRRHKPFDLRQEKDSYSIEYRPNTSNWFNLALKERSKVESIHISTRWFTGNQVRGVSVILKDEWTGQETCVIDRQPLKPDKDHEFSIPATLATECSVHCYYDGGISRIHLFGEKVDQIPVRKNLLEQATVSHVSNDHYGGPETAVAGNRSVGHMLGWESARTGCGEHAFFELPEPALLDELVVDTYMHVYNSPMSCHLFGLNNTAGQSIEALVESSPRWTIGLANGDQVTPDDLKSYILEEQFAQDKKSRPDKLTIRIENSDDSPWTALLPFAPLSRDTFHRFELPEASGVVTHLKFMFFPNGGIHGLKVFGKEE